MGMNCSGHQNVQCAVVSWMLHYYIAAPGMKIPVFHENERRHLASDE